MKIYSTLAISLMLSIATVLGQTTKTVGVSGANYSTLKSAFDAINSGSIKGAIILQIIGNTTETASAILNASGSGASSYTSLLIYPAATSLSISASGNWPTIDLNGADNVTIDGRVNQSGNANMTIVNSSTGTFASAIRFITSAESNTVKYCNINSSCYSAGVGMINFTSSNIGNGNDNNIVEYCNVTNAGGNRPYNAIFSSGSSGRENSGNIIRNNNIFNFFNANSSSYGINISNSSTDWTISDNSFYETTTFSPTGAYKYYPLFINTGNNNNVSNNYIGGSEPLCEGSAFSENANFAHYFCGIFINGGTAAIVQNNIIQNINFTSVEDNPWDGIYISSGNVDVIGNTIGATIGTGSITLTTPVASATTTLTNGVVTAINLNGGGSGYTTPPVISFSTNSGGSGAAATAILTGGIVTGFNLSSGGTGYTSAPPVYFDGQSANSSTSHGMIKQGTGTVTISGNNIGSITTIASDYYSQSFEAIYVRSDAGMLTLSNNLIGSLSTANSIHTSATASSSLQKQDVYGIYCSGIGTTIILGNTVANLHNAYTGINSGSRGRGIQTTAGSNTIQNNTVRNISSVSRQASFGSNASVIGISQTSATAGTTQTVTGNSIYDLSNTNATSARVDIYGMYYAGPTTGTHEVSGNFVHSLSVSSTNVGSDIDGIVINSGTTITCANNIINLGEGITIGCKINGIWDGTLAGHTVNFYFNTIYIGGNVSSGVTSATAGLWNANNTSTRNYRNNILYNARTGGTTGKHYAIVLAGVAGLTIDYNDYFVAGAALGKIGSLEKADLTAWKSGTGQDVNSLSINPGFAGTNWTSALNYYTSAGLPAATGTGILTDYSGVTRNSTSPQMGALENNDYIWRGTMSSNFGVAANWEHGAVPPDGSDISFDVNPANHCVLDQNRSLKNITNAQADDDLVTNGHQLTITGSLNLSGGAQINASSESSEIVFAGSAVQSIPSGAFVSNTIDALSENNNNGLILCGNLTVEQTLTLTSGNFAIGANTLNLNGAISIATGTLTGGATSNLTFGGSGASTNLPAITLYNLTINRLSGINLTGSVSITGTLVLSSGTLTVGANTLTISGSSPARTSGSINAGNAGATIAFTNASAITLPVSVFTGTVNNLTINNTGGVTASSDFTVTGVLNLQGSNPSDIKGRLDIGANTLTMGANATTTGVGDVTGIVKRTSFVANTVYTFGNAFTTVTFPNTGTLPTEWMFKTTIGNAPGWKIGGIKRTYDIIRTGGTGSLPTIKLHYLDAELNSNTETDLVFFGYLASNMSVTEYGRINADINDNWVSLSGSIEFASENFGEREWVLSESELPTYTWLGTVPGEETNWNANMNWSGGGIPTSTSDVHIPVGCEHYPTLPSNTTINSINIDNGATMNGGTSTSLTINGGNAAWFNRGTFNPETSTISFANSDATMSGETNFYNLSINSNAGLTLTTNNVMRISGSLSNSGSLDATVFPNTVEYNGENQIIVNANGATTGYYNLTISGSGAKTMPVSALPVLNNLNVSGTTSVTALGAISIDRNFTINEDATFGTGSFSHIIGGDINCDGTLNSSTGSSVTLNGTADQSIYGSGTADFTLYNLLISNTSAGGILLSRNATINNNLTIASGSKLSVFPATHLSVTGTLTNNEGVTGLIVKSGGSLIENDGVAATVEREITGDEWHLISSPVSDATSGIFTGKYLQTHTESTNAYTDIIPTNVPLIAMKGYALWGDGGNTTIVFPGTLNTGLASYSTLYSGPGYGWNLAGNPYPSSIDWNAASGWDKTNVNGSIYLHVNAATWATFNGSVGTNGGSRYIPPCQGFFVEANAEGTLSMDNSVRTHNAAIFFKNSEEDVNNMIRLQVSGNGYTDEAVVLLLPGTTAEFDGQHDARKFFGDIAEAAQIYTLGSRALSINCIPETQVIPVGIHVGISGIYTIAATEVNGISNIRLEDIKTGLITDIRNNAYTFSFVAGENEQRFILHFDALGIDQNPANDNPEIYAFGKSVYISTTQTSLSDICIRNIIGQPVRQSVLKGNSSTVIDLSGFPKGVYIVSVASGKHSLSRKIILK